MRHVVAVAAPIGGGKTSLVNAVARELKDAVTFHYDSYEKLTGEPVDSLIKWVKAGARFDELSIPGLARDLGRLKGGETVVDPLTQRVIPPGKYIIFEMPLGRSYPPTAGYIDILIWIDMKLDIALARKIKEFTGSFLRSENSASCKKHMVWLDGYIDNYLRVVRDLLLIQKERVSAGADIIVNGDSDLDTVVQHAKKEILTRIPS